MINDSTSKMERRLIINYQDDKYLYLLDGNETLEGLKARIKKVLDLIDLDLP